VESRTRVPDTSGGGRLTRSELAADTAADLPRIVTLPVFRNKYGSLGVAEFSRHIGFTPHRFYFIKDVPPGAVRGVHAHRRLRQCMFCLNGAVTVKLEKARRHFAFRLERPDQALLVPPGCWRVIGDFTGDAVVGVLASEEYDEADYIYKYENSGPGRPSRRRERTSHTSISRGRRTRSRLKSIPR